MNEASFSPSQEIFRIGDDDDCAAPSFSSSSVLLSLLVLLSIANADSKVFI